MARVLMTRAQASEAAVQRNIHEMLDTVGTPRRQPGRGHLGLDQRIAWVCGQLRRLDDSLHSEDHNHTLATLLDGADIPRALAGVGTLSVGERVAILCADMGRLKEALDRAAVPDKLNGKVLTTIERLAHHLPNLGIEDDESEGG